MLSRTVLCYVLLVAAGKNGSIYSKTVKVWSYRMLGGRCSLCASLSCSILLLQIILFRIFIYVVSSN